MRYALIKNNIVKNVILANANFVAGISHKWDKILLLPDNFGGPGWVYDGSQISPPQPSQAEIDKKARKSRLKSLKAGGKDNLPINGPALQELLQDILDSL